MHAETLSLERRSAIDAECARMTLSHLDGIAKSTAVLATLLALIIRERVPGDRLLLWLGATYVIAAVRVVLARVYDRRPRADAELPRWLRLAAVTLALSSTTWGMVIFVSDDPKDTVLYAIEMLFLGGLMAGGAQSIVATPWLLVLISVGDLGPLLAFLLTSGVPGHLYMALTVVVYVTMIAQFARKNHRLLRESVALRFGNLDLVSRLTEEKAAAVQARDLAERATRATNQFLAAASHDIRQPVHAAFLFLGALEQGSSDSKLVLDRLRSALVAARQMLDALLDISRLDAGVVENVEAYFEARALADKVSAIFAPIAERKGLSLRFHVPRGLWLRSDPGLCERIVANLTSNALKYTSQGGALVAFRRRGERCLIQVWDTGSGIAGADQAAIFDEFRQLGNPERDAAQGIGLGLAIVKRLARLLDTQVELRSAVGRGSVFSLMLPLGAARVAHSAQPSGPVPARGGRVLVVDDNALVCDGLSILLGGWGYDVRTARDTRHAAAVIDEGFEAELALVDYRLPENQTASDAIAVIHHKARRSIPAIIITGDTHPERIREAVSAGHTVLFKPVPADVLEQAIERLLTGPAGAHS